MSKELPRIEGGMAGSTTDALIADRSASPREDFVSVLVSASRDGDDKAQPRRAA
ncbi:MAG: hypothetical protein R2731_06655 [Nocardioides sp.]